MSIHYPNVCAIWPMLCFWMFSLLSKDVLHFYLLHVLLQLVLCRISSIVQIIFYFWSFEIIGNILKILKLVLCLGPYS